MRVSNTEQLVGDIKCAQLPACGDAKNGNGPRLYALLLVRQRRRRHYRVGFSGKRISLVFEISPHCLRSSGSTSIVAPAIDQGRRSGPDQGRQCRNHPVEPVMGSPGQDRISSRASNTLEVIRPSVPNRRRMGPASRTHLPFLTTSLSVVAAAQPEPGWPEWTPIRDSLAFRRLFDPANPLLTPSYMDEN